MKHWWSKALIDYEISHEEYRTIINEEEKYWKIKEDIRMIKSQRSDELNEKDKKIKSIKKTKKMHKIKKFVFIQYK